MALDQISQADTSLSWFACARCGTRTNSEWVCLECRTYHNLDTGEALPVQREILSVSLETESIVGTYKLWSLWKFITPGTQWYNGGSFDIKIQKIEWMKWRFQRLYITLGTDIIKLETNGERIRDYKRKVNTGNGIWKWYRWETGKPAKRIKEFLEEKLWAKFAES